MASLTGQLVAETYKALLKTIDNDILTASEKQITDGFGGGSNVFIDSQGFLRANKYKVTNGLATQFLKADGSLDSNTYLTGITSSQIISALGYTPVPTTRTLTINGTTYDLSANRSWTIDGTSAVWGNISGTLSNQTDLQNALNAKYNNPTGTISQYIRGDGTIANFPSIAGGLPTGGTAGQILAKIDTTDYNAHWIDNFATQTKNEVKLGQTLAKGAAVYVSSANGTNMIVSAASNASEATSSKTLGLLETGGVTNDLVKCVTFGLLAGLDTSTATAGDPVWLGVNGALIFGLANKPYAPAHLVYIGVVTRVQSNNGEIFVNVQNGFELKEIHDVYIADPANNHGLFYDSADGLWKNKSIVSALGYTPQAQLSGTGFVKASGTTITYDNSTYLTTTDAASTYQRLDKMVSNLLASATEYPNSNAVINALALKADALNPVFTGYMTISGAEPKLYFTDTDQNPDYFIGADAGFFRIYDQTAGATRFVINSSGVTTIAGDLIVGTIAKSGGTATQFLKADGSIDSSTYVTSASLANYLLISTAASTYQRLDKMVSNLLASDTEYPNSNAVLAKLALKADAANPVFTGDMTISGIAPKLYFTDTDNNPDYTLFVDSGYFYIYDQTAGATKFQITPSGNAINTGTLTSASFIKSGGTSSQYLMADGSVSTGPSLSGYLLKSGGTMTGQLNLWAEQYQTAPTPSYGLNAQNSDIIGINAMYFNDNAEPAGEGINFWRSAGYWDTLRAESGVLFFAPNRATGESLSGFTVYHSGNLINPTTGSGTSGYIPKYTGSTTLGNSQIFDTGTNVGINNSSPTSKFVVSGSHTSGRGLIEMFSSDDCLIALKKGSATSGLRFQDLSGTDNWFFGDLTAGNIVLQENFSTTRFTMFKGGNFVIGNGSDAGFKLDVNGTGRFLDKVAIAYYTTGTPLRIDSINGNNVASNTKFAIGTGGQYGTITNKKFLDIDFNGYNNYTQARIRSWDENGSTGYGSLLFYTNSTAGTDATKLALQLNYNGAAGFFASVDVQNMVTISSTSTIMAPSSGKSIEMVYRVDGSNDYAFIQTYDRTNSVFKPLRISANSLILNGGSEGNIGIGTTGPLSRLHFYDPTGNGMYFSYNNTSIFSEFVQNAGGGAINLKNGSGTSNIILRAYGNSVLNTDTGNVGVGTGSPDSKLHVVGTPGSNGEAIYNLVLQDPQSYSSRLGAGISFGGDYGSGLVTYTFANIKGYKENTTNGDYAGALAFSTRLNGGGPTVRMLINSSGRVVIGNGSANGLLQLHGSHPSGYGILNINSSDSCLISLDSSTSWDVRLRFKYQGSDQWFWGMTSNNVMRLTDSGNNDRFTVTQAGAGTFSSSVTATSFFESSDFRLKKLIENNPIINGIENLQAKLYEKNGKIELGYFAQDAEILMPYAVNKNSDGFLNLSYREVHTAKIARLEKRVAELEKQLNLN